MIEISEITQELKELEEIPAIPRTKLYEMMREAGENRQPPHIPGRDMRLMASFTLMANRCTEGLRVTPKEVHKEISVDVLRMEIERVAAQLGRLRIKVDIGESLGRGVSQAKVELGEVYDVYLHMTSLEEQFHKPGIDALTVVDEIAKYYPQTLAYVVRLFTLKRKKKISRVVPIPTLDPLAPFFVESLERDMGKTFYGVSRQRVWQLLKRAGVFAFYQDQGYPVPKNPLRHLRLSEVSNVLNRAQLYRYAGWKLKGTQDKYVHMKWDDFMEPLVRVAHKSPPFLNT